MVVGRVIPLITARNPESGSVRWSVGYGPPSPIARKVAGGVSTLQAILLRPSRQASTAMREPGESQAAKSTHVVEVFLRSLGIANMTYPSPL